MGGISLEDYLPRLKENIDADVVIANGENAASGRGITKRFSSHYFIWG